MRKNTYEHVFRSTPENNFFKELDIDPVMCGYDGGNVRLNKFHPFASDRFFRIHYVVSGSIEVVESERVTRLEGGHVYLFPAGVPITFRNQENYCHYWLHFYSLYLLHFPGMNHVHGLLAGEGAKVDWKNLMRYSKEQHSLRCTLESDYLFKRLLLPFCEKLLSGGIEDPRDVSRFGDVIREIEKHFSEDLPVARLAAIAGMSVNTFSKAFHRTFLISPKEYVIRCRLEHAKWLLLTSNLTVREIAAQCGYRNEYFFYRIFRQKLNRTPAAYRKNFHFS